MFGIGCIWKKKKNGFFLFDSRKVKQIRIWMQREGAVGIGWQDIIRVCEGNRLFRQSLSQSRAVLYEKFRVYRVMSHCSKIPSRMSGTMGQAV